MASLTKTFSPYVSKHEVCDPITEKVYDTPPELYLGVQPPDLEQFSPEEALKKGTLWPELYGPYTNPFEKMKKKETK